MLEVSSNKKAALPIISDTELLNVQKPAQYLGGELNSVVKDDAQVDVHIALAFPDTYEVGMSHIGLQILYQIINSDEKAWAERVYMPLADMEALLREKKLVLSSLESKRPIRSFDILGFSLQYELCGTNILTMLDLGGIPLLAEKRDDSHPIVLGGGPYSYHPEALAPFFDAFFLGDAEEAMAEVLEVVRAWKHAAVKQSRLELLKQLSRIDGIYVPSFYQPIYDDHGKFQRVVPSDGVPAVVQRRLIPTLENAPYASKPIVPNIRTVHNRLSIEVMRGCVRGCRFCQAGYLYRPQRERSPKEVMEMVEAALGETGYEELSLLSLSTADYCSVVPLLKALMDKYGDGDKLAISFPSTRVDALKPEVLEQVQRVRRTGFTVAPEAGTQRLRDVINKGVSDEQILETCQNVFRMGWNGIKLYFMLGLPTETDEDLLGIVDIASRVKRLPEAKGKDITVSVSTHVPKPHTPFQWVEQISPTEVVRRQRLLADGLRQIRVNFRYHDSYSSFLEGVFCRGDRDLSRVLLRAYELGCRLDAWTEMLDQEKWNQAFLDCNIDPLFYLRARGTDEALPWDHLSCGISKPYFLKELSRALKDKATPDCLTQSCSICGACDYDVRKNILWPRDESEIALGQPVGNLSDAVPTKPEAKPASQSSDPQHLWRVRIRYEKSGVFRFIGHLELVQVFQRAAKRAQIPLAFSSGYHPMPRLSFGPPLQLGVESRVEYVDAYLTQPVQPEELRERFNKFLPDDLRVESCVEESGRSSSIQESLYSQTFRFEWLSEPSGIIGPMLKDFLSEREPDLGFLREVTVRRTQSKDSVGGLQKKAKKNAEREFLLGEFIGDVSLLRGAFGEITGLELELLSLPAIAGPRPTEIAQTLLGLGSGEVRIEKADARFRETSSPLPPVSKQPIAALASAF